MKGLPFSVTKDDILQFFNSHGDQVQFGLNGIFLVEKPSGDLNGDAFVIFADNEGATRATNLKGSMIGNRYVEIFYSTPAEMNQVITGTTMTLSKRMRKPNKNRDSESSNSPYAYFQNRSSSLNRGLIQNIPYNQMISIVAATMTTLVPKDATDDDFDKYLGDCRGRCITTSRYNLNNPNEYTSYVAGYGDIHDAESTLKYLSDRLFKIGSMDKGYQVQTIVIKLESVPMTKTYDYVQYLKESLFNSGDRSQKNLPHGYSSIMHPPFNIYNPLQISCGPMINYGVTPIFLPLNQHNQFSFLSNVLQQQLFNGQFSNQYMSPLSICHGHYSASNINNHFSLLSPPLSTNVSQATLTNKSNILLLYGIQMQMSQHDFDMIFNLISPYITALPKLHQVDQFYYAIFRLSEDARMALQRCPVILYKNQIIHLISINQ